jgi:Kdo2-lipid IVA lauroyltransferase/acyltransferase
MENYHLYRLALWLVARLPLWLVYFLAGVLAEFNFLFDTRARRGVWANQSHVLPPGTSWFWRWRSARAAFRNFGYSIADFFRIPQLNQANKDLFVAGCAGWDHMQKALSAGTGGIFVTVHMGSWELAGAYLGLSGLPLTAVALPHRDPRIDQIFISSREAAGMEVVKVGGALTKLDDALRRGRFVALLADRDIRGKGPLLPFFGQPTHMPDGHALLALQTGAWIFPARVYRLPNGLPAVDVREPIIPDPSSDTQESLTLRCITSLEEFIRANPEQWFSFYNLWHQTEKPVA